MASLEEIIAQISEEDYLHDPIQFIIDSDLRIVSIPGRGVVAGVVGDKNINRINFQMNRYYNGFDMSKFTTRINYINSEKILNYYSVTDMTIEDDLIYFTWLVESDALAYSGTLTFAISMFLADESGKLLQAFNTSDDGKLTVLSGIQVEDHVTPEEQNDILRRLESDVSKHIQESITNAEKSVMNYAKNEAVDSMNQSAKNITTENITKIQNEGVSERQKISQKGTEMIADLKRKLYFTDESSGKTYVGELKIINGKPSLEYKESV